MPNYPKGNQLHPDDNLPSGNPTADREYYQTVVDHGEPFSVPGAFSDDDSMVTHRGGEPVQGGLGMWRRSAGRVRGEIANDIGTDQSAELNRTRYRRG